MARKSAFSKSQKDIEKYFERQPQSLFTTSDIERIFWRNRDVWKLPQSWNSYHLIKALIEKVPQFREITISFPSRRFSKMSWEEPKLEELALSISDSAYLSHYTAMVLHGLTNQLPKIIYVTVEQNKKLVRGTLSQEAIDKTFGKPQRISQNLAKMSNGFSLCLLNGKHTNRVGVIHPTDELRYTNIERTLIDAAVRPAYCGGVYEVLQAFERAEKDVSINKLIALLKKLNYIYPYHQVIGFYLEKTNLYSEKQIERFRDFDFNFDFYLTYNMKNSAYSKKWRLYYPMDL